MMTAGNAKSLQLKPRVARIGNDLLKRQVDDVHENVLGDARNEMGSAPPFRFRRGLSGRQAFVFLGFVSNRNETGIFQDVTGKPSHLAPPPEYSHEQEGPYQFQWVKMYKILSGDSCFGKAGTICIDLNHLSPLRKRGETSLRRTLPNICFT